MTTYLLLFIAAFVWPFQPMTTFIGTVVLVLFIAMLVNNRLIVMRVRKRMHDSQFTGRMMEQAVKISENNVVCYVLRDKFIHNLYGNLLPVKGISVEDWKNHVHPDDLAETMASFLRIINGESSSEEFFYRWNYEFGDGEPRWGYLHDISVAEYMPGTKRLKSIISTLRDETELHQQEMEEGELTDKYWNIFEHSIIGLSFYSPEGWLMDSNKMMRDICHFDSETTDEFFSKANLFDMAPFSECVDRNNVQEMWICAQSIVPERNICDYLEIHLHPIFDDLGKLIYIAVATRNISEERQMYLQAIHNDRELQRVNEEIKHYEEELRYMMENCNMQAWRITLDRDCIEFYQGLSTVSNTFTLKQLQSIFVNQDDEFVRSLNTPAEVICKPLSYLGQVYPVVTGKNNELQWIQLNSIPEYDEKGNLTGSFGVFRNISNIMQKQDQLRRETERANDSGRLKAVFLANMTHEIRTPLNAIVGFTDLLTVIESPDDKREMIRLIHNNCDMLLRLINDILVLSNVDANAMEIVVSEVDFAQEFATTCVSLAQRVQEPGVEFQQVNPYENLKTYIDSGRIQQVITNFVTNAVKYTHQGHIQVGYRLEERNGRQGLYVYCEDTGSGIPKEKQDAVFERFVKLNDFIQGTGLGLSICKAIIEKCNGEIGLESEVDQGSTFWFWIPIDIMEIKEKTTTA